MEGTEQNKIVRRCLVLAVVCGIVLLGFSLLLILVLLFFLVSHENPIKHTPSLHKYQISEIDFEQKVTRNGIVQLHQILGEEDYMTYHNEETGTFSVISRFRGRDYECSGSCFCDSSNVNNERRYSTILRQGVYFVISAFSVSMALEIAGEAFRDQCFQEFEGDCQDDKVTSEVEECKEKGKEEAEEELKPEKVKYYSCSGYCIQSSSVVFRKFDVELETEGMKKFGLCEAYNMDQKIGYKTSSPRGEALGLAKLSEIDRVRYEFKMYYLDSFCKQSTCMGLTPGLKDVLANAKEQAAKNGMSEDLNRLISFFSKGRIHFCAGVNLDELMDLKNVECVEYVL